MKALKLRIGVLTDLIEDAKKSKRSGSWYNPRIGKELAIVRGKLDADYLAQFDEMRKTRGHRKTCRCMLCLDE
jgi:hypothetical protein